MVRACVYEDIRLRICKPGLQVKLGIKMGFMGGFHSNTGSPIYTSVTKLYQKLDTQT